MIRNIASCALLLVIVSCVAFGQVTTGAPPFSSTLGSGFQTINLGNLNTQLSIPVLHKAGRGAVPLNYDLLYDSAIWYPVTSGSTTSWQPVRSWGWGGGLEGANLSGRLIFAIHDFTCYTNGIPSGGGQSTNNYVFYDQSGSSHNMGGSTFNYSGSGSGCTGTTNSTFTSTATDGSGLTLNGTTQGGTLISVDGRTIVPPANPNSFTASSITDTNGNYAGSDSNGNFTDTLGSTSPYALVVAGAAPNPVTFTYPVAQAGSTAQVIVHYTQKTVKTNFGCSSAEFGPSSENLVNDVTLPDGTSYTFSYETTPGPGNSGYTTGRIASVLLPTGGTISFNYTNNNNNDGIVCSDGSIQSLQVTTPDGTTTYSRSVVSGTEWLTKLAYPDGNNTNVYFQEANGNFYETERDVYQGASTTLESFNTCYNGNYNITTCDSTAVSLPITLKVVWKTLPVTPGSSAGVRDRLDTSYNSNGLPTQIAQYDYAPIGSGQTVIDVKWLGYASLGTILDKVNYISETDGTNQLSQTTYGYDENSLVATTGTPQHGSVSGSRGNLTSIHRLVQGSTTLDQSFTYYDTGVLRTSVDVNGATTTYQIGSSTTANCGNSFVVEIDGPLSLNDDQYWDCAGAVMTSFSDPTGNSTSTTYYSSSQSPAYDPFYRPIESTDQAGNHTYFTYGSNSTKSLLSLTAPGNAVLSQLTTLDSQGRDEISQRRQSPTSSYYDSVQTIYDALGRPYERTLPYQGTSGQTASGPELTTTTYDGSGRPTEVQDAGGGWTKYTYSDNDTYIEVGPQTTSPQTENTKKRQLEYDGEGRLTSVCELTTALSGYGNCAQSAAQSGYWTTYAYAWYSSGANVLTVTQNAQSSTAKQTRTYYYDKVGRLTSETNPESGTTTYVYDTDPTCGTYTGDLVKKADAVGNVTCYAYDARHRVTSVTYQSGSYASSTPDKYFIYDGTSVNGIQVSNTKARLMEAYTVQHGAGVNGTKITDEGFSYSQRGEITDVYESTPHSGGYYHLTAAYWPHGTLSQLGIPGVPALYYGASDGSGLDGEGRVNKVTVPSGSGQNPVTAVTWDSGTGTLDGVTYGSGDFDTFSYDPSTLRQASYAFTVGSSPQTASGTLTWNANATLQKLVISDPFNSSNSQTCTYITDDLARLAKVTCGTTWQQTFSFDAFGNVTKTGTQNFTPSYSSATNRINGGGYSTTYDANGNQTNDGFTPQAYTWNADNNPVTLSQGSTSVTVIYDALGRAVENQSGSTNTEIAYGPEGDKLALLNGSTLVQAYVSLPGGGQAVYNSSGLAYYRHPDWLGSSRFASTPARTMYFSGAYAPYGESYVTTGITDLSFTGQDEDTLSGLYDFMFRRYSQVQGRWISPDPSGMAAVDPSSPQTWNRYSYVGNNPINSIDLLGLWGQCGRNCNDDDPMDGYVAGSAYNGSSGNCNFNGLSTDCGVATGFLGEGGAVVCPSGDCKGIVATANGEIDRNTYSPNLVLNCDEQNMSNYECAWTHWSKFFIQNANDIWVVGLGNDVPVEKDFLHDTPQCPNCGHLMRNASGAANAAFVGTGVVLAGVPIIATVGPTILSVGGRAYSGFYNFTVNVVATVPGAWAVSKFLTNAATNAFGQPGWLTVGTKGPAQLWNWYESRR